jgi:transcriptional regulator with XRE-family HTH domain
MPSTLSQFIDANWDALGMTNDEAAARLGFKATNLVSMWRTGRTPVPMARLGQLADLLAVDLVTIFVLWLKQERLRNHDVPAALVEALERRVATANEAKVLVAVRTATKNADPSFTSDQVTGIALLAAA